LLSFAFRSADRFPIEKITIFGILLTDAFLSGIVMRTESR
jgi:hypothetical protein